MKTAIIVIAVLGPCIGLRTNDAHGVYSPNLGSSDCCSQKGWKLCGWIVKDCCKANVCDQKMWTEWCPANTQVEDEELDCDTCSLICNRMVGMQVCSTGLTANQQTQCCS